MQVPHNAINILELYNYSYAQLNNARINGNRAFVGMAGFEKRSYYFIKRSDETSIKYKKKIAFFFDEYKNLANCIYSRDVFRKCGVELKPILYDENNKQYLEIIRDLVFSGITVIDIDITSFPRWLYCNIVRYLGALSNNKLTVIYWYTPGKYLKSEYPTAGISKIRKYCGKPSLRPSHKAHLIGLGFDELRTQGILTDIETDYLCLFFSDPAINDEYLETLLNANSEIIRKADNLLRLGISNYEDSLSKILAMVTDLRRKFEVIIIPDGPKPLILISSIIPFFFDKSGVITLHIGSNRRKTEDFIDVEPIASPIGLHIEYKTP